MRPQSAIKCLCILIVLSGIALLPGCGGSSSTSQVSTNIPTAPGSPIANCQIKQINALKPPCPPNVNCTTAPCTAGSLSCSALASGDWNEFSQYILGSSAVYGVNIYVPWASVDTGSPGTGSSEYDFSALDAQVSYYTANYPSKKVNLMWMAVNYGNVNDSTGGVNQMTPAYVFTTSYASSLGAGPQDVTYCSTYPGANGYGSASTQTVQYTNASMSNFDSTGYPVVYETPFATAYQNFVKAVIAHYNGNSTIGYIRFGLSVGDEADAYCTAQMQALPAPNTFVSPDSWENYISAVESTEKSSTPSMTLMESLNALDTTPDPTTLPSFEAATAVGNGFGFGSNGWEQSDISALQSNDPTSCTADWCALFQQYHSQAVQLELQPANPSDVSANNPTGNLATLITETAATNYATILELAQSDLYLGLQAGYTPPDASDSANASAYANAINHPCDSQ
jgi:hypothetical protein